MADEPQFRAIVEDDPAYRETIEDAQATLPQFRALLRLPGEANSLVCVRTRLTVGATSALVWLMVIQQNRAGFATSAFEVPPELAGIAIGARFEVASADVVDWMYNLDGILYGGYSLRYQRAQLPEDQRAWFDERIGVTEYG